MDNNLMKYFRYQIVTDQSETYGDGYRQGKACVDALGLDIVLDHIRESNNFPSI